MKRDLELLRKIIIAIEASVDDEVSSIRLPVGYDPLHLSHHIRILFEAGLIHAFESRPYNATASWVPHSLTWAGYEFLAAVRDPDIWRQMMAAVAAAGGELPVAIIEQLALREWRRRHDLAEVRPAA
ncbi:MAG: DUF2513 domain-containing protein [Hyphomicrobiales bacterium]